MRSLELWSLAVIAVWAAPSGSVYAQSPKNETAKLYTGWKLAGDELQVGNNRILFASTGYGVSFNSVGAGFLHGASWICASSYQIVGGAGSEVGSCSATDTAGNQVWTTVQSSGPKDGFDVVGVQTITGGTGRLTGIEGRITFTCTILPQFHQLACTDDAKYRLP